MASTFALLTFACPTMLHDAMDDRFEEAAPQRPAASCTAAMGRERHKRSRADAEGPPRRRMTASSPSSSHAAHCVSANT